MLASSPGVSPASNFAHPSLHHQFRRAHLRVGACKRELDALVLPDRPAEHLAIPRVVGRLAQEPFGVADAFRGDQQPFGVHAVQDVAEAAALDADQVLGRDDHVVEEHLGRVVVHHRADRADRQALAQDCPHVHDEGRQPLGALSPSDRLRRGARQQQHQVGVFGAAGPDLLAIDDVFVALLAAKVRSEVVSVPLVGSVTPNACSRSSPVAIFGR